VHRVRFPREFWFNSGLAVLLLNCHPIRFGICVPVHTSLTKQQQLHRWKTFNAAHYRFLPATSHDEACCLFKLTSLTERRDSLCSKLFRQLVSQSHILHCLLPEQRDDSMTGRLPSRNKYPTVRAGTNRFKNSFIPYAIANYQ